MAHDYARKPTGKPRSGAKPRNKSPQKPTTQGSTAKAFLAGMLTGAVCMYFIPVLLDDSDNQASIAEQREEAMSESKNQGLKFDFYTLLYCVQLFAQYQSITTVTIIKYFLIRLVSQMSLF